MSATPAAACRSSTTVHRPTTRPSSANSASPPSTPSRQRRNPLRPRGSPSRRSEPSANPRVSRQQESTTNERTVMTENLTPTAALSAAGVSIWLDDLSRERIKSGGLQKLIAERNVVGITTNPTIFASALAKGEAYDEQIAALAAQGSTVTDAVFEITTEDVADASDIFRPVYEATHGFDGRVSIEVEPGLAHDAAGTFEEAKQLWAKVNHPNVLIKIPATIEGLEAITNSIGEGISVNVTLIFSLERYREVINAYLAGLEKARSAGDRKS